METSKKDFYIKDIYIIFLVAFMVRLIFAIYTKGLFFPEAWEYEKIAVNLYNGKGFLINFIGTDYYGYSTPLFPLLCAITYKLFGHYQSFAILLQIALSSLLCVLIYLITIHLFVKRPIAILSSIFIVFHPGLIIYSSLKLHALTLDALMISLTIFCFILVSERLTFIRAFSCGIVYGLCALTRSTIIPLLFPAIIWLYWENKTNIKQILKYIFVLVVTGMMVIGLWTFRNFIVFKKFVPITTLSSELFWRGNNIHATGTSFAANGERIIIFDKELFSKIEKMNEIQRYDLFNSEAKNFIKNNPKKFLLLTLKKFYYFWWFSPDSGKYYQKILFYFYQNIYIMTVLFAVFGVYFSIFYNRINFSKEIFLFIAVLTISIMQSLFYIEGRHRLAIEPLLLIFSSAGFIYIIKYKIYGFLNRDIIKKNMR